MDAINYQQWCQLSESEQEKRLIDMDAEGGEGVDIVQSACDEFMAKDKNVKDI